MKSNRTKYLSYIEEHRKHHSMINDVAKKSSEKAISESHSKSVAVTYLEGENIVQVDAKGNRSTVGKIENNRRKVKIGDKDTLSKK